MTSDPAAGRPGRDTGSMVGPTAPAEDLWHRLSPRMLLIHPVKEVARFFPALIAVVVAGSSGGQHWWGVAGAAIAIGLGVLRWFTTRYRFTTDQVQLRRGLVNTTTVSAPIDRVRSVDVTSPVLHRLLGLAEVRIGTGAGEKALRLDGLTSTDAAALRGDLLHRAAATVVRPAPISGPASTADGSDWIDDTAAATPPRDITVYRLSPSWIRYAPFGPAGVIAALAVLGIGTQFVNESGLGRGSGGVLTGAASRLETLGVVAAVAVALLILLGVVVVLALMGYVLAFHGFRLSRDARGGTLHVSRGLLTTRATSLEIRRMRGVELHRPLPLRWAGGARLEAITTGVKEEGRGLSTTLTPPSPLRVVQRVADDLLDGRVGDLPLRSHGPRASRRRYTRAVGAACLPAAAVVLAAIAWHLPLLGLAALLPLGLALLLGRSRAHWLGHAVTERFLVTRSGSITLTTDVVERRGAVGVIVRRTFFQRRAGLATVSLATAAGRKEYRVPDLPLEQVGRLAAQILPEHVDQFLE